MFSLLSHQSTENGQIILVLIKLCTKKTVAKIKYQLQSQGFTNIADFSKDGDKPFFMQDTIHMGVDWLVSHGQSLLIRF